MADWREIRNTYNVGQLEGLNFKVLKDTEIYMSPINKPIKWEGWQLKAGQITGKLYSWVSNVPANQNYPPLDVTGVWLMFFLEDKWDFSTNAYYIKLKPKMFDWSYTKTLLDTQRKSNMNWYETMLDDFDTSINEYKDDITDSVTSGLYTGLGIAALMLYMNYIGRYQIQSEILKSGAKSLIKEFKK